LTTIGNTYDDFESAYRQYSKKYGNYKIISAGNSGGCGKLYGFLNRNNAGITTNLIKFL
jgi:hypothetical protein